MSPSPSPSHQRGNSLCLMVMSTMNTLATVTITLEVPTLITILTLVALAAWWMSAMFIRLGRVEKTAKQTAALLTSQLGGVDEDGTHHEGTLTTANRAVENRVATLEMLKIFPEPA